MLAGSVRASARRVSEVAESVRDGLADKLGLVVGLLAATVVLLAGLIGVTLLRGRVA